MARSRLAPLRQLTVVRLELQAAVLAVRLTRTIKTEIDCLQCVKTTFWSDSKVILSYIQNENKRFHTFVANRIAEIRSSSTPDEWRYVPSGLNPADLGSRGTSAESLLKRSDWVCGPEFLGHPESSWPSNSASPLVDINDPEVRASFFIKTDDFHILQSVLPSPDRFSSWTKYRRVVAWVLRFINIVLSKKKEGSQSQLSSSHLTAQEIQDAEWKIVKHAQKRAYPEEIAALETGKQLSPLSKLRQLSPFIDDAGMLRVGGRLDHAPVLYGVRHPVILPPDDDVTRLVITSSHYRVLHSGLERTLTDVKQRYWVPKGRSRVKQTIRACTVCRRRGAKPTPPFMSDLPVERFDMTRAFSTSGVDYFGPLLVKRNRKEISTLDYMYGDKSGACRSFAFFGDRQLHYGFKTIHSKTGETILNFERQWFELHWSRKRTEGNAS